MTAPVFTPPFKTLVDGVSAYFTANEITATVWRGIKERTKSINQGPGGANRVVFLTCPPDGRAGQIVKPRQPGLRDGGGDPNADPPVLNTFTWRPLADWKRTVLVSIWARDASAPEDQGAQDDACWQLFVLTMQAVNAVMAGNADFGAVAFTPPVERAFGLELLVELTFQTPLPDVVQDLFHPNPVINKSA